MARYRSKSPKKLAGKLRERLGMTLMMNLPKIYARHSGTIPRLSMASANVPSAELDDKMTLAKKHFIPALHYALTCGTRKSHSQGIRAQHPRVALCEDAWVSPPLHPRCDFYSNAQYLFDGPVREDRAGPSRHELSALTWRRRQSDLSPQQ